MHDVRGPASDDVVASDEGGYRLTSRACGGLRRRDWGCLPSGVSTRLLRDDKSAERPRCHSPAGNVRHPSFAGCSLRRKTFYRTVVSGSEVLRPDLSRWSITVTCRRPLGWVVAKCA